MTHSTEDLVASVARLDLGGMMSLALIGYLVTQASGGGIRPASRTTKGELRRLAREAGLVYSPASAGSSVSRRLDFHHRSEVVIAA